MTGEHGNGLTPPEKPSLDNMPGLNAFGKELVEKTKQLEEAKVLGNGWGGVSLDTERAAPWQAKTPEEEAITKASIAFGRGALFDYDIAAQFGSNIGRPLQQQADTAVRIAARRYGEENGEFPPIDLDQAVQALVECIAGPPESDK